MKRILLVRLDGVGDALALVPLVAALRDAGHVVGALLATRNADAFAADTFSWRHLVERIPWPQHGSTPQTYRRALEEARTCGYDVALVASEEPEAYHFAKRACIAERVGFVNGMEKPLKTVWAASMLTRWIVRPASARRHGEHEVETLFRLGKGLHKEARPTKDVARLRPLVTEHPPAFHGRVVIQLTEKLHRLGVDTEKLRAGFRAVAQSYASIGVAQPSEAEAARSLADECGFDVETMESMSQWKAIIAGARAVLTPDSGAAHVAGMTGTGCVDLFADGTCAERSLRRWYPWASERTWPIAVTPRVADRFADHVRAGIAYVSGNAAA